jgi:CheY-like chemotaxis protein
VASVLVIDDELDLRLLVRVMLERGGHNVIEASTGEEGLALLEQRKPDLLILDLRLADIDGVEVLRKIKAGKDPVQVVVLTAHSSGDAKQAAEEAGCDGYLSKPFDRLELLKVVESCLANR